VSTKARTFRLSSAKLIDSVQAVPHFFAPVPRYPKYLPSVKFVLRVCILNFIAVLVRFPSWWARTNLHQKHLPLFSIFCNVKASHRPQSKLITFSDPRVPQRSTIQNLVSKLRVMASYQIMNKNANVEYEHRKSGQIILLVYLLQTLHKKGNEKPRETHRNHSNHCLSNCSSASLHPRKIIISVYSVFCPFRTTKLMYGIYYYRQGLGLLEWACIATDAEAAGNPRAVDEVQTPWCVWNPVK
jgi:hypothetical protein